MNPSFSMRSNRLISSTDVARAIASLTLSASSLDMSRPAFPCSAGFGSSLLTGGFDECVETVCEIVVASCVGRLSAVRKSAFAACLSYRSRSCEERRGRCKNTNAPCREFAGNRVLSDWARAMRAIPDTTSSPAQDCLAETSTART